MSQLIPTLNVLPKQIVNAIVVVLSAGAFESMSALFINLPKRYPVPIIAVVHLPPDKDSVMAECLRAKCQLDVHEACDKEPIRQGTIYLAPPDYHLLVERDRRLSLSNEEAVQFSRPSIDVLFESAADVYGPTLIGVILSGANSDGAKGLRAVMNAGGNGLVQCPHLAYASTMPQAALDECPGARAMSVAEISDFLQEVVSSR